MPAYPIPPVVSREEWLIARKALLVKEKELTRQRDALGAERRRLPVVKVDQEYAFEGPRGKVRFIDLFEGRRQLYIHHFMWIDAIDQGCPMCTIAADMTFNCVPWLAQLEQREVTFACVARAPYEKIAAYKARRGWTFPFYSSAPGTFHYDFHATLDESKAPLEYNYRNKQELLATGIPREALGGDWPVNSVFVRDERNVYHAYSAFARGLDQLFTPYNFLDLTPYGRQEDWEDSPEGWPQKPTYG